MCLAFFEGKGYSVSFTSHTQKVRKQMEENNPIIEVVAEADCICEECPNLTNGLCTKAAWVARYDRQVLLFCGLAEHTKLPWRAFAAQVAESILSQGKREDICGSCQWTAICKRAEYLYL